MTDKELSRDDLTYSDYVGAVRYLRAYSNHLKETNFMRDGEIREWCETVYEVTSSMSDQLDEILAEAETKRLFERIVSREFAGGSPWV